jgi:hypothetical protein
VWISPSFCPRNAGITDKGHRIQLSKSSLQRGPKVSEIHFQLLGTLSDWAPFLERRSVFLCFAHVLWGTSGCHCAVWVWGQPAELPWESQLYCVRWGLPAGLHLSRSRIASCRSQKKMCTTLSQLLNKIVWELLYLVTILLSSFLASQWAGVLNLGVSLGLGLRQAPGWRVQGHPSLRCFCHSGRNWRPRCSGWTRASHSVNNAAQRPHLCLIHVTAACIYMYVYIYIYIFFFLKHNGLVEWLKL